tara:strand:- start:461 stop:730 length:270 start_codon:yes stop_codon:yes gene_type:complete
MSRRHGRGHRQGKLFRGRNRRRYRSARIAFLAKLEGKNQKKRRASTSNVENFVYPTRLTDQSVSRRGIPYSEPVEPHYRGQDNSMYWKP